MDADDVAGDSINKEVYTYTPVPDSSNTTRFVKSINYTFGNEYVENADGTTGNVQNKQIGYTYDDNGNVIAEEFVNNPLAETEDEQGKELTKYTYDSYNRLTREDNPDFGTTCYVYDDKGNITKKYWREYTTADTVEELKYALISPNGERCGSALCGSSTFARSDFKGLKEYPYTTNYAYDNKGQLVGFGNKTITYDNYGHPENYLGNALEWTNGRLTKLTKPDGTVITYTYDARGCRTSKTVGDKTTKYYYGHNGSIIQEDHDSYFINYKYDVTGICGFDLVYMDGDIYKTGYFHYVKDLLGNIKYILDNNGNIVVEYNYDAWGNVYDSF